MAVTKEQIFSAADELAALPLDDDDNEGQGHTAPSARPIELDLEIDDHRPQPTE